VCAAPGVAVDLFFVHSGAMPTSALSDGEAGPASVGAGIACALLLFALPPL
jgi:hypothetical protein